MRKAGFLIFIAWLLFRANPGFGQEQILDKGWYHLRNAGPREWSTFAKDPDRKKLLVNFKGGPNPSEHALSLRQFDVKLNWKVLLNGHAIGSLVPDEKDLMCYFKVPAGILKAENTLEVACADAQPDDIKVGDVVLHEQPLDIVLSDGQLALSVTDPDSGELIPARITITNATGTLQSFSGSPAARPGYIYTGSGTALIALPEGTYKLYAGRGFEYGVDSTTVVIKKGKRLDHKFAIKREVSTPGWVSSDTHIHTFTWSGHGDATDVERVLTIVGEGIELPIITEHNLQIDFKTVAQRQGVDRYFTPVTGNEVTTEVGHFNVFPLAPDKTEIDHRIRNWKALSESLGDRKDSKAIILNHARDIHASFRPFDPAIHLSSAGMRLDGWEFPANGMEVINSGAQQTDRMELTRDWFGMLNHGDFITPAGASDSHDVSRYIVGQARTYIRCDDEDPANLDVQQAVRNFREGNVMVSFGLLTEIEINDAYGPGELVPASDEVQISVKVAGPAWTRAESVALYANGKKIREEKIENQKAPGIKWSGSWNLTMPTHDIFLVALAEGPDNHAPYWPIGKPYQPTSPDWVGGIFGLSGAVWLDADRNAKRDAAFDYARSLQQQFSRDFAGLIQKLASYDEAVAIQVAALLHQKGENLTGTEISKALHHAAPETKSGFQRVIRELTVHRSDR
ncbi:MAG: CehA/McbA family metallohydrolase [Cyclobacteriaceae bacterium]